MALSLLLLAAGRRHGHALRVLRVSTGGVLVTAPVLERATFTTPRDSGYAKIETLEKLTGQRAAELGHVILKELIDNSLDECENAGVEPEISVTVTAGGDGIKFLTVEDNGRGIPVATVAGFCDFNKSASDKSAYRSPTRGAQGNAWPCIISIPFALGVRPATVVIEAQGVRHEITPDQALGKWLTIGHVPGECDRTAGTRVTVPLPVSLNLDVSRWVADYATVNLHATFTVRDARIPGCASPEVYKSAGQDGWRKWVPCRPTSPHWYDSDALTGLISAYLAAGSDKPIGMFVREFDGLTSTAKARKVAAMAAGIKSLSGFKDRPDLIGILLMQMKWQSRPVKPPALGVVPEEHYRLVISRLFGISRDRCWTARKEILHGGIPWAVDVVVAETERPGRVIYATNFGITFGDPLERASLRSGTWYDTRGAESFLRHAGAYPDEGNAQLRAAVVHVQCGAPRWTDTGKVALIVPAEVEEALAQAFAKATKKLRDERERLKKDADKERSRQNREARAWLDEHEREQREPPLKETVRDLLTQAQSWVDCGERVTVRDLYEMVLPGVTEVSTRDLSWRNFRQILAGYEKDHGEIFGLVRREELPEVDLSRHPRGPEELKAAAKVLGVGSYDSLLALSVGNDPYAIGRPAELKQGRWFAELAGRVRQGMEKIHIRGFHYRWDALQGSGLDGRRYRNDKHHWEELSRASKIARVLGLVNPETFSDRRNDALRVFSEPSAGPQVPRVSFPVWIGFPRLDPAAPMPPLELPGVEVTGYEYGGAADQPEVLVVVTEKMEDVLEPMCRQLCVDLLGGTGYESYTRALELLRHAEGRRQRLHVFYVSDYDNAGENMPVTFGRHLQFFADRLGVKAEITLQPIALTREQVARYHLPKAPDKRQTELDSLEALHPGTLAEILRDAVLQRRDATLAERLASAAVEAQSTVEEDWQDLVSDLRDELERIRGEARAVIERRQESERAKASEIAAATAELRAQIAAIETTIKERFAVADAQDAQDAEQVNAALGYLADRVRERWHDCEFDLPERPEPEVDLDDSNLLYDSRRHWLDQLKAFKAARAGTRDQADVA
jgi:hypothetical protein